MTHKQLNLWKQKIGNRGKCENHTSTPALKGQKLGEGFVHTLGVQ